MFLILILIAAGCLISAYRWRWGILAAILLGLVQDPLRKGVPGTPGILAMTSVPVWLSALGCAWYSGEIRAGRFFRTFPRMAQWTLVFLIYLSIPAALSATYGHNTWMITLLGILIYGAGGTALLAGYQYPTSRASIQSVLMVYGALAGLLLVGGPLDWFGWGKLSPLIGTEAMGHVWVTHRTGETVYMLAGFFRSPDVMGWHAATVSMVAGILALRIKGPWRIFWLLIAVWGLSNIWLCGRRKMVSMIPVFWGIYLLIEFRFRDPRRLLQVGGVLLLMGSLAWIVISETYRTEALDAFYLTTLNELNTQAWRHGIESVITSVEQAGFWGYGLGFAQQGVHHIEAETPRIWQESGMSKIVLELGVPGLTLFLLILFFVFRTAYLVVGSLSDSKEYELVAGLFALLGANLASSIVSAQIFGDPFILLLLFLFFGFVFSSVRTNPEEVSES